MASSKFYAIVAGAGSGTGASIARKFGQAYLIVLLSRSGATHPDIAADIKKAGGEAISLTADISDAKSVAAAFADIKQQFGDRKLAAAIFNVGGRFVRKPFLELTEEEYRSGYDSNGLGFFLFAQATLPLLLDAVATAPHPPSLIVTGATASVKGSAQCASFASGKWALRATTQSLAKEFGPQGVHVAHSIIDGGIDTPWGKERVVNEGKPDGKLSPDAIADSYWFLHTQPRNHFTWEIDARPFIEKW